MRIPAAALAALLACGAAAAPPHPPVRPPNGLAPAEASFAQCLARLKTDARARGVSAESFDRFAGGVTPDRSVLALLDYQPEFRVPIWDYLAGLVDDERIADGLAQLERRHELLAEVERRYGVDARTVVAVWGVESDFGKNPGSRPLVISLATLACEGRRQEFFRGEFLTALRILQDGHIEPQRLLGSWAGAFGHTQFMPSSFMRLAVDFDGDGRRDIVGSVPDALASTANFLKQAGWRSGEPWGFEVRLPPRFDPAAADRRNRKPLAHWASLGVRRVDGGALWPGDAGQPLGPDTRSAVLLPSGASGPAFVVLRNFDAIHAYNASISYGLAIAHLSDRLRGAGPFVAPWPTDDPGLSRAERRALQSLLAARGHDIGEIDGIVGVRTRDAIRAEEGRLGIAPSGRAGRRIVDALKEAR